MPQVKTSPPPAAPRPAPAPKPKPAAKAAEVEQMLSPPTEPMVRPDERELSDGSDLGLEKVKLLDPKKIHSFNDLTEAMAGTMSGGRDLGEAVAVAKAMAADKDCLTVLTLSGNATPFGLLFAELLDRGLVKCVVSSGAVVTHSFSAERGRPQFQIADPDDVDDSALYNIGGNRIYDVLEMETSLDEGYDVLQKLLSKHDPDEPMSSADVTRLIGQYLNQKHPKQNGLLHAAERNKVPIIVPAFSDSEIGLDFFIQNLEREKVGKPSLSYDAFLDWKLYCSTVKFSKSLGIITLGGGVPRNWAQQIGPSIDIETAKGLSPDDLFVRFRYAIRICNAPSTEGSLSGCTYAEGLSWGKFLNKGAGGQHAEIIGDYSVAFPLIVAAVLEEKSKKE